MFIRYVWRVNIDKICSRGEDGGREGDETIKECTQQALRGGRKRNFAVYICFSLC